jgi:hypothetical protein
MKPDTSTAPSKMPDETVARITLQRISREERLLERAEGRIWLQCLPLISIGVFGLLWLIDSLRPFLIAIWVVAPIVLIQIALWTSGRRIDALLNLLQHVTNSTTQTQIENAQQDGKHQSATRPESEAE